MNERTSKKRCPKCGCDEFFVSAHVVQDWKVNSDGDHLKTVTECVEVTHAPDDDDIWTCFKCSYSAAGSEFNVKE